MPAHTAVRIAVAGVVVVGVAVVVFAAAVAVAVVEAAAAAAVAADAGPVVAALSVADVKRPLVVAARSVAEFEEAAKAVAVGQLAALHKLVAC